MHLKENEQFQTENGSVSTLAHQQILFHNLFCNGLREVRKDKVHTVVKASGLNIFLNRQNYYAGKLFGRLHLLADCKSASSLCHQIFQTLYLKWECFILILTSLIIFGFYLFSLNDWERHTQMVFCSELRGFSQSSLMCLESRKAVFADHLTCFVACAYSQLTYPEEICTICDVS